MTTVSGTSAQVYKLKENNFTPEFDLANTLDKLKGLTNVNEWEKHYHRTDHIPSLLNQDQNFAVKAIQG